MVVYRPTIRAATGSDAAELARLISPLGYVITQADVEARWGPWTLEGNTALVVEGQGSLLGVITLHRMTVLHRSLPVGRITSLAVDLPAQGRGLGRALVHAAEAEFARAGCGMVEVTSHTRRLEAHQFYEHLGYLRTSHRLAKDLTESAGRLHSAT